MDDLLAAVKEIKSEQNDDREIDRVRITSLAIAGSIVTMSYEAEKDGKQVERRELLISPCDWDRVIEDLPIEVKRSSPVLLYGIPVVFD